MGLSVYPYLTKIELLRWSAYTLLFFLTVESFREKEHVKQFAWFLLSFGFVVSLFAIVQHFTFNGKLYWLVPLRPGAAPFGPFVDCDHFAGFVELIVPLGLALLFFRSWRREQLTLLLLFTFVPIGALILSASRGGIIGPRSRAVPTGTSFACTSDRKKTIGWCCRHCAHCWSFIVWLGVSRRSDALNSSLTKEFHGT